MKIKECLACEEDEKGLLTLIENISKEDVNVEVLKETKLGKIMKTISKANKDLASGKAAKLLVEKWRVLVKKEMLRNELSDEEERSEKQLTNKAVKFKCKECDREFRYLARFQAHTQNKHNSSRPPKYLCENCPKRFCSFASVERHNKKSHGDFNCDQCDFNTDHQSKINSHTKTHLQTEFKCSLCADVFLRREDMWKHKNNKHRGKRAVINITCQVCSLKYKNKDSFRVHMKKHHPVQDDCEETQVEESLLTVD